jgi:hypothetical protein
MRRALYVFPILRRNHPISARRNCPGSGPPCTPAHARSSPLPPFQRPPMPPTQPPRRALAPPARSPTPARPSASGLGRESTSPHPRCPEPPPPPPPPACGRQRGRAGETGLGFTAAPRLRRPRRAPPPAEAGSLRITSLTSPPCRRRRDRAQSRWQWNDPLLVVTVPCRAAAAAAAAASNDWQPLGRRVGACMDSESLQNLLQAANAHARMIQ